MSTLHSSRLGAALLIFVVVADAPAVVTTFAFAFVVVASVGMLEIGKTSAVITVRGLRRFLRMMRLASCVARRLALKRSA